MQQMYFNTYVKLVYETNEKPTLYESDKSTLV